MRIRNNLWAIEQDATDETLLWYSRAIGVMKQRPIDDPLSLRFQAAIHAYDRQDDPLAIQDETLPNASDQDDFWNQCQHNSWFFLPWHRMYLHHFEQIVGSFVEQLGGPADWALPYWNYHDGAASRVIPPTFRQQTFADGEQNHLFVAERRASANDGSVAASEDQVALHALLFARFSASNVTNIAGFGGRDSGFQHSSGSPGWLEQSPHGAMHMYVNGWMAAFHKTGLDPLFYCHHCNIDRLWEVWLRRDINHVNPNTASWLRGVDFPFRNKDGARVDMRCEEVVTTDTQLDYLYADTQDPFAGAPDEFGIGAAMANFPEMVGATRRAFTVQPTDVGRASISAPKVTGAEAFGASVNTQRTYLHLENLTCQGPAEALEVYVGVDAAVDPAAEAGKRAAYLSLFGLQEATRRDGPHSGAGLTFGVDITDLVRALPDDPGADALEVPISLRAVGTWGDAPLRVGRISLYAEDE